MPFCQIQPSLILSVNWKTSYQDCAHKHGKIFKIFEKELRIMRGTAILTDEKYIGQIILLLSSVYSSFIHTSLKVYGIVDINTVLGCD